MKNNKRKFKGCIEDKLRKLGWSDNAMNREILSRKKFDHSDRDTDVFEYDLSNDTLNSKEIETS